MVQPLHAAGSWPVQSTAFWLPTHTHDRRVLRAHPLWMRFEWRCCAATANLSSRPAWKRKISGY